LWVGFKFLERRRILLGCWRRCEGGEEERRVSSGSEEGEEEEREREERRGDDGKGKKNEHGKSDHGLSDVLRDLGELEEGKKMRRRGKRDAWEVS